jgi:PAS domain S-box-containing protein
MTIANDPPFVPGGVRGDAKAASRWSRKVQVAFGSAILTLLVVGGISYRTLVVADQSDQLVRHTHEVLETLADLVVAMTTVESSARGFALSGDETYLVPYRANILRVEQGEATLRNLTLDNPNQQDQIPALETLAAQKIQGAEGAIVVRRAGGLEGAGKAFEAGLGRRLMDEFQAVIRKMQDEELRLLTLRDAEAAQREEQAKIILFTGTVLGLLIAVAAGWSVQSDLTARRAAVEHLAQMESRYRGLLEAAPDAMVVVNPAGYIVLLNVQAEKQFGYSRDELLGQKVKNIIPEGFAERLIADALRSAEDARAQKIGTGIELSGRRKDGSAFPIEIMLSPLESPEGFLVTAAIRDISVRKQSEAHLLLKMDELNRSNEELRQFAYIASHDLQEPLRMVASYTQLLSRRYKGKLDADADEFIAYAVDGANRMQRLIQDLLTYSRVGTKGINLADISSEKALQHALANLHGAIGDSAAVVTHDPLPDVMADEGQLTQLFQNLVGNGIKYHSTELPRVHISAARQGGRKWLFSVKDNGLGIDKQYFERIFGMFQRLHKREEFAGTGIGLAICKKIVERHGSHISVESQPGQGSTFRFALTGSEGAA